MSEEDIMLTFTADDGSYLADVDVTIGGKGDQPVLHTRCAGPIMLVNLPAAGNYQLRASVNGHTQTRRLQLRSASAHQRLVLRWPAAQAGLEAAPARVRSQAGEQSLRRDRALQRVVDAGQILIGCLSRVGHRGSAIARYSG